MVRYVCCSVDPDRQAGMLVGISTLMESEKISNDQELIQSDPISCPQNQKGNN